MINEKCEGKKLIEVLEDELSTNELTMILRSLAKTDSVSDRVIRILASALTHSIEDYLEEAQNELA